MVNICTYVSIKHCDRLISVLHLGPSAGPCRDLWFSALERRERLLINKLMDSIRNPSLLFFIALLVQAEKLHSEHYN